MEKIVDMHTHSTYSDGDLTPNELVLYAKSKNIGTFSITDHDTVDGIKNLNKNLIKDINFYPGIELTAKTDNGRMHILGYNIDINNNELNNKLEEIESNVMYSMMLYFTYLKNKNNITFSYKDIQNILKQDRNISRNDIAKLMIDYGYSIDYDDAFDTYLNPMYNDVKHLKKGISPKECIELINEAGGIAVLAHPHSLLLNNKELFNKIKELKQYGLEGVEVYHSNHSYDQMNLYNDIAQELNLLVSGGSDYHGKSIKSSVEIGTGKDNLYIKELSLTKKYKSIY